MAPENNKLACICLLLIISISLILRLSPVLLYGYPLNYDPPFHLRSALSIIDTQSLPLTELSISERPNNYPPFYHLLLAELSLISGISPYELIKYLLPFFSAFACISAFLLARNLLGRNKALLAALLFAIMPPLVINSYDSPENFILFFLPLIILLISRKNFLLSAFLYSTALFWNYFIFIASLPAILLAYRKEGKFILFTISSILLILLFSLFTRGPSFFENKSLDAGMDFVIHNLGSLMLPSAILFLAIAFVFSCLYLRLGNKSLDFFLFFNLVSIIGLASSFFTFFLRPWEYIKFAAISSIFLGLSVYSRKYFKVICFIALILLLFASFISYQGLFSRISRPDIAAIEFVGNNHSGGKILAEPSLSEYIGLYSPSLNKSLLTSLYYENQPEGSLMPDALNFLMEKEGFDRKKFLADANVSYLLFNYEDFALRSPEKLYSEVYLDKVYSLQYYNKCPLPFIGKVASYACYWDESAVLKVNSLVRVGNP